MEGITFREWGPDLRHHLGLLLCFRKIFGISRDAHRGSFPSARHSGVPQGSLPQIVSFQLITNVACHSLNSLSPQHFRLLGNVLVRGGSSGRRYGQFLFHDARGGGKVHQQEQAWETSAHPHMLTNARDQCLRHFLFSSSLGCAQLLQRV